MDGWCSRRRRGTSSDEHSGFCERALKRLSHARHQQEDGRAAASAASRSCLCEAGPDDVIRLPAVGMQTSPPEPTADEAAPTPLFPQGLILL
ncbi:hypothetical protein L1887_60172 [Cichorium endivia]|nr:hypothetical protein L1887_60172 [Cichorium endivia]